MKTAVGLFVLRITTFVVFATLVLPAQPPFRPPEPGLQLLRSIPLNRSKSPGTSFSLGISPDGTLQSLARSGTGRWSIEEITGWELPSPSITARNLSLNDVISGPGSHANMGETPDGRYLLIVSSNDREVLPSVTPARTKGAPSTDMLTVIDPKSNAVLGNRRFASSDGVGSYGFYNNTLITLLLVAGLPFDKMENEFRAWKLPELTLLATCRHSAMRGDANHPVANPNSCDNLVEAIGASSFEEVGERLSGTQKNPAPADSRLGSRLPSAGLDPRIQSPDGRLIMQRSGFAGNLDPITILNATTGQIVGIVPLPRKPAKRLPNGSFSREMNWAMLASGTDNRNYLLVLMPDNHVNVYLCPNR